MITLQEIKCTHWEDYGKEPVIEPPVLSPIIADQTFIVPADSHDGRWRLYVHLVWGIHRFISGDGVSWEKREIVARNAMRP